MTISITWLGHGTLSLDVDGTTILVDPFLDSNPVATKSITDFDSLDYILVTHGHMDHIADLIPLAQRTRATVVGMIELTDWAEKNGVPNTHAMNLGGGWDFPFGRVKMTPALHSSSLPDGSYGGDPAGFLLTVDGKNIYIAGDTALFSDMALIGKHSLDLAIIPIGDNYTMGPEDALTAVADYLKPKAVIPVHYGTFPVISHVDVGAWEQAISEQTQTQPILLSINETYTL